MPTKERREQEARVRVAKEEMKNPPEHLQARIGKSSRLAENIKTKLYNNGISKFDDRGQSIFRNTEVGLGANAVRKENMENKAIVLRRKYPEDWGKCGTAEGIAVAEGHSPTTIRRYMRKYPKC